MAGTSSLIHNSQVKLSYVALTANLLTGAKHTAFSTDHLTDTSVVIKDLRLKDEDKDEESSVKDKDKDLKIGPRGSLRTGLSSRTTLRKTNTYHLQLR